MEESSVTFKATINGLILIMKEEEDFETVFHQIETKLASAGRFFKGASISVKYRGRKLSKIEEDRIVELMTRRTGAEIRSFEEDMEEAPSPEENDPSVSSSKFKIRKLFFNGINEGNTRFYRGTVRSGQLVSYDGNLVVIGDVNPGGEVEATGNVVVMGSLRGMVHAGADGNKEALVVALNLQPTQLRIAEIITRPPDEKVRSSYIPELAYIKDETVYIERFLPQFK
jgi:septum site-determining protein MinC